MSSRILLNSISEMLTKMIYDIETSKYSSANNQEISNEEALGLFVVEGHRLLSLLRVCREINESNNDKEMMFAFPIKEYFNHLIEICSIETQQNKINLFLSIDKAMPDIIFIDYTNFEQIINPIIFFLIEQEGIGDIEFLVKNDNSLIVVIIS